MYPHDSAVTSRSPASVTTRSRCNIESSVNPASLIRSAMVRNSGHESRFVRMREFQLARLDLQLAAGDDLGGFENEAGPVLDADRFFGAVDGVLDRLQRDADGVADAS